jgi:hypothetical protein
MREVTRLPTDFLTGVERFTGGGIFLATGLLAPGLELALFAENLSFACLKRK